LQVQPAPERWDELAPLLLLVIAVALVWLAPAGVGAQLEARARADTALYLGGGSPLDWRFDDPRARVGPLQGLVESSAGADALELGLIEQRGDLGLRLSGQRIDPEVLPILQLDYRSEVPLRLRLRAAADLDPRTLPGAWIDLPARHRSGPQDAAAAPPLRIALGPTLPLLDGPIEQLRLEFEGRPTQRFALHSAQLLPARCGNTPCIPERIELSEDHSTRWLLAVRDESVTAWPHARVGAAASEPLVNAAAALSRLDLRSAGLVGLVLVMLAWASSRLREGPARSACALMLGAITPALLLSLGLPRFPPQAGDALLLAAWAIALWLLWPRASFLAGASAEPEANAANDAARGDQAPRSASERPDSCETERGENVNADAPEDPQPAVAASTAQAWGFALGLTLLGTIVLAAGAWIESSHSNLNSRPFETERALRYLAWAALQQFWLARFALPHLKAFGLGIWTLPLAGLLFAALHLPNLELMGLTFVGGCCWAWMADHYRRLLPQIASHTALGLATAALLPPELLRSLEVGGRYVFAPL
jgi:hypothetical protein